MWTGVTVGPRIVVERDASSLRVDANSTIQAVDVVVVGHKISQESLQIMMYRLMGCALALAALSLGTSLQVVQLASSHLPTSWLPLLFSSLLHAAQTHTTTDIDIASHDVGVGVGVGATARLEALLGSAEAPAVDTFGAFDQDGNGVVTPDELRAYAEARGVELTEEQIREIFALLDDNRSGAFDLDEYLAYLNDVVYGSLPKKTEIAPLVDEKLDQQLPRE